jgi:ribosomal protein S18 acetylase RimI-like enzyme
MARAHPPGGGAATEARQAPLIRDATKDDAAAVARVHVESWRAAYREHMPPELLAGLSVERRTEGWRELLGNPGSPTLVAELDGEIVGFAGFGPSRDTEGEAELYAIYLDPARFGTGVGRALMDAALERLRALGYEDAILWVLDGNERAERFYERAGWRREEVLKTEEFGGTPVREVRYRRRLSSAS